MAEPVANPATEQFRSWLQQLSVKLPLTPSAGSPGAVEDIDGRDVFVVDVNSTRSDEEADLIALWIITAVNTCGGFKAEVAPNGN